MRKLQRDALSKIVASQKAVAGEEWQSHWVMPV
jgi:hypothetical protein